MAPLAYSRVHKNWPLVPEPNIIFGIHFNIRIHTYALEVVLSLQILRPR
jgi:hypothetical protein